MKDFLLKSYYLIPLSKRKKIPVFFLYSFLNTILDLISIIYLVPIILVLLDKDKLEKLTMHYLNLGLTRNLILILLGSLLIFYIVKNSIQAKIINLQSKFIYSIATSVSKTLVSKFIFESYKSHTVSDKNAFFRDAFQLPMTFATNVLFSIYNIFSEALILVIIAIVSFIYSPWVTLISFVLLSFLTYLLLNFQKKKVTAFNETIVHLYQENVKNIMNIIQGFVEIKSTKSEEKFQKKLEESNQNSNEQLALFQAFKQSSVKYFEILFILGLSLGICFYIFSKENTKDLIFLSFLAGATIKIIPSFNKILNAFLDIKANKNAVKILSKYDNSNPIEASDLTYENQIVLEKICFDYDTKEILNTISLDIQKGDFITISGNSGEGKSTLLYLIAGLLSAKSGTIEIDGFVLNFNNKPFDFVGYASQQPFLFQGSLLENITMLQDIVDEQHLQNILIELDLIDWVDSLPNGLNTILLLESKKLSGGQKQRIALARALYFKPKILLLDEATNQLNEKLELKIFTYLNDLVLKKELTIVAISHGEKVQQFANKKYHLENGILKKHV